MDKVTIIAEAGVNHNGSLELAYKLIDMAKECGADVVKFQTFKASKLSSSKAEMANYQKINTGKNESQLAMLQRLEISDSDHLSLVKYCQEKKIKFLSTGFDMDSLSFFKSLKLGLWKTPSGEITNLPYLEFIGRQNEKVIVSTGMSTIEEVSEALSVLIKAGTKKENITVLQCTTEYPADFETLNLNAMVTMARSLGVAVGFSDHSIGATAAIAAVALGAVVIEKHITLDKNLEGPDHKASMEPHEFMNFVKEIRNASKSLGDGVKKPHDVEIKNRLVARKSLVAAVEIKKDEIFTLQNLTSKRPGTGLSPMKLYQYIGKKAHKNYQLDDLIEASDD